MGLGGRTTFREWSAIIARSAVGTAIGLTVCSTGVGAIVLGAVVAAGTGMAV